MPELPRFVCPTCRRLTLRRHRPIGWDAWRCLECTACGIDYRFGVGAAPRLEPIDAEREAVKSNP